MKFNKLTLCLFASILSIGAVSCSKKSTPKDKGPEYTDPSELGKLEALFNALSTGYNFTLDSHNEADVYRTLNVFNKYCFYYSYHSFTKQGEHGMFYVEGQSTQDFHIENDQVVVDFHEGPGKVELVENFAHDDYGSEFAHIPMSELLGIDWTHFYKVDENNYYTQDKAINRVFNYYTNEYLANWKDDYGGEDYYVNFDKSKTSFKFNNDGSVLITFLPKYQKNVSFSSNGSFLTISNIGTTQNSTISAYLANPNPITKRENYGFNEQDYLATFGNVSIPFSSKFSGYMSPYEDYKNAAITVYDMCYENGILEDIQSNLPDNWEYDEEESNYWTKEMGHTTYSYHSLSTISREVEGQTIENEVDVYYSIAMVPAGTDEVERTLRPNGFFVGQVYRKLGEEAITDYDEIVAYLENNTNMDYLPDISRVEPYGPVLRDYTEKDVIKQSFIAQGFYLYNYLELRVEGLSSGGAIRLAKNFRDDLNKLSCYSSVELNETTYDLTAMPDTNYFDQKGEPYMQIMGSAIRNSESEITGYQLLIIAYAPIGD